MGTIKSTAFLSISRILTYIAPNKSVAGNWPSSPLTIVVLLFICRDQVLSCNTYPYLMICVKYKALAVEISSYPMAISSYESLLILPATALVTHVSKFSVHAPPSDRHSSPAVQPF